MRRIIGHGLGWRKAAAQTRRRVHRALFGARSAIAPAEPAVTIPPGLFDVRDPAETLQALVGGASIARFGDGELRLCLGHAIKSQPAWLDLQLRLVEVLRAQVDGLLIGVPWYDDAALADMGDRERAAFWHLNRRRLIGLWDPGHTYHSAFISRPDALTENEFSGLYTLWEDLWRGRDVVLVGNASATLARKTPLAQCARSITKVEVPQRDAWRDYDRIIASCLGHDRASLFLVAAGAAATVIAHDLHLAGRQAIDCGHLGGLWKRPRA